MHTFKSKVGTPCFMSRVFATIFFCSVFSVSLFAQNTDIPKTIGYQGQISNNLGIPLSGDQLITITLYGDPHGKNIVWQGKYTVNVTNGLFNVLLGRGGYPLPSTGQMNRPLWAGISVDGQEEMKPLTQLTSVPYALNVPDQSITLQKLAPDLLLSMGQGKNPNPQWIGGNTASNNHAGATDAVAGGTANDARDVVETDDLGAGHHNFIGGGESNTMHNGSINDANHHSAIAGGESNSIRDGDHNFIGGGLSNFIHGNDDEGEPNGSYNVISGGESNELFNTHNTIGGGKTNTINGDYNTISGGLNNALGIFVSTEVDANYCFIGGGENNGNAGGSGGYEHSVIAGGKNNRISGNFAFVGGGEDNGGIYINASDHTFIGGGKIKHY